MHKQITFHLFFTFLLKNKTASCKCHPNVKIYMHHESVENCHSIRINLVLQSFELTKRESSTSHYRYRIRRWNISFLLFLFFFFFQKPLYLRQTLIPDCYSIENSFIKLKRIHSLLLTSKICGFRSIRDSINRICDLFSFHHAIISTWTRNRSEKPFVKT